jgi:hypothetical protein
VIVYLVSMKKRNLDIGLDDGLVTPTLIPHVPTCPDATAMPYPIPNLEVLSQHGFSATVEIEPREWEKRRILDIVDEGRTRSRIVPETHFAAIMARIRAEAVDRYGPDVDTRGDD